MLQKVKNALRILHINMDEELTDLIEACKHDLMLSGIVNIVETDPLIIRAIIVYCKANFSFSTDANYFRRAYDSLKFSLTLNGVYTNA